MEFSDDERLSLQRLLRWRRDVRHFRTDPVPEALLDTLKEAMSLAPSVGNARPWRVLQVENHRSGNIRCIFLFFPSYGYSAPF